MIYRLYCAGDDGVINAATTVDAIPGFSFLFVPEQPLYQTFKAQINADEAQLQDADGNTMSAEDAKQFVSTLP